MLTKALQNLRKAKTPPLARQDFDFIGWNGNCICSSTSTVINECVEQGSKSALRGSEYSSRIQISS